jgi:hypothetical protein
MMAKELPAKIEQTIDCDLDPRQWTMYLLQFLSSRMVRKKGL